MGNDDVSVSDMLDNMADPEEQQAKKVGCPISGCDYTGEPESVSGHVSASSQSDHIWSNTQYDGWRDFNEVNREQVEEQLSEVQSSNESQSDSTNSTTASESPPSDTVSVDTVECPIDGCTEESDAVDTAVHIEGEHSWSDTRFEDRSAFFDWVLGS